MWLELYGGGYCNHKLYCKTCHKTYSKITRKIHNRILLVYMYGQWKIEFYWLLTFVLCSLGHRWGCVCAAAHCHKISGRLSIALDLLRWPVKGCPSFLLEESRGFHAWACSLFLHESEAFWLRTRQCSIEINNRCCH